MPWTLYKYILREMLKLLMLSAGVLVVVISFAAAVRPLSEGLLGPIALVKFVGYTAPTMLGFALPFAGAFAATLVFLRMAADNEITACSASGLSYASILTPVLLLGVVLTMSLFFMSNYVMPWFYMQATRIVEKDLITALVTQLDKKQPYILEREGYVIYADRADEVELDPEPTAPGEPVAEKAIILHGVAFGVIRDDDRLRSNITAQQAKIVVFRDAASGTSWVNMTFEEVMYEGADGKLLYTARYKPLESIRIPSPFADQVEFLSWPQLRRLRAQPETFDDVRRDLDGLITALSAETLLQYAHYDLTESQGNVLTLYGLSSDDRYLIRAPKVVRRQGVLHLTGTQREPVTIDLEIEGQTEKHYEALEATIQIDAEALGDEPTLSVVMAGQVRVFDVRRNTVPAEHEQRVMPQMVWPTYVLGVPRGEVGMDEAQSVAGQPRYQREIRGYKTNPVVGHYRRLAGAIDELFNRVTAQLHSRAASAIACTLLLLLGAVLSMKMKHQMALVVYFWSFLLAVVTIIIIHTGTNMVHGGSSLGGSLALMWSGNVILAAVVGWSYCQLARN